MHILNGMMIIMHVCGPNTTDKSSPYQEESTFGDTIPYYSTSPICSLSNGIAWDEAMLWKIYQEDVRRNMDSLYTLGILILTILFLTSQLEGLAGLEISYQERLKHLLPGFGGCHSNLVSFVSIFLLNIN